MSKSGDQIERAVCKDSNRKFRKFRRLISLHERRNESRMRDEQDAKLSNVDCATSCKLPGLKYLRRRRTRLERQYMKLADGGFCGKWWAANMFESSCREQDRRRRSTTVFEKSTTRSRWAERFSSGEGRQIDNERIDGVETELRCLANVKAIWATKSGFGPIWTSVAKEDDRDRSGSKMSETKKSRFLKWSVCMLNVHVERTGWRSETSRHVQTHDSRRDQARLVVVNWIWFKTFSFANAKRPSTVNLSRIGQSQTKAKRTLFDASTSNLSADSAQCRLDTG